MLNRYNDHNMHCIGSVYDSVYGKVITLVKFQREGQFFYKKPLRPQMGHRFKRQNDTAHAQSMKYNNLLNLDQKCII